MDEEDIKMILSVPIIFQGKDDALVWHFEENGQYLVKSSYHQAWQCRRELSMVGSTSQSCTKIWRTTWNTPIMPKNSMFLWKACKGILPVRLNIHGLWREEEMLCPRCGKERESVLHALVMCEFAQMVWYSSPLTIRTDAVAAISSLEWFLGMSLHLGREQIAEAACLSWCIWQSRNEVFHEDKRVSPGGIILKCAQEVSDYKQVNLVALSERNAEEKVDTKWLKPRQGLVKVNCDAAIRNKDFVGVGYVVRDHSGKVVGSCIERINGYLTIICADRSYGNALGYDILLENGTLRRY